MDRAQKLTERIYLSRLARWTIIWLTVIITLLIGSSLAGLEGALIALPIVAVLKVAIRELRLGPGVDPPAASRPVESDNAQPSTQDHVPPSTAASS